MSEGASFPRKILDWRLVPLLLVTAIILWLLLHHIAGVDAFAKAVSGARWGLVWAAVGVFVVDLVLSIVRWQIILWAMSKRVGFFRCAHAVLATWPLAVIIPARAGDVLRAGVIRKQVPFLEGAGSVVAEKVLDIQSLCLLSMIGSVLYGRTSWTAIAAGVLVTEWLTIVLLLRYGESIDRTPLSRFAPKVQRLLVALRALLRSPRHLLGVMASSLAAWVMASTMVHLLLLATGFELPYGVTLSLWPLAIFVGMLPITVAGMGTRDAAFLLAVRASVGTVVRDESVVAATLGYSLIA
ncbi:MAG TPA: lysylphosphatidylglycerol synthase transmembrane domain-containing protein, partial [Polyangiaceae bacterium]|nr:lysylphosphatidylglycerol synthase transmembrane domain-containing protein [Polyangiaceae bacterium]